MPTPDFFTYLQRLFPLNARHADVELPAPPTERMPPGWSAQLERQIETHARAAGIPYEMADRLVRAESNYDRMARGTSGEIGLTQLMPKTAVAMGVTDPTDPDQNLRGGFQYLRQLLDRYDGNYTQALMAYNWGPTNVSKALRTPPTGAAIRGQQRARAYAEKVGGKRE